MLTLLKRKGPRIYKILWKDKNKVGRITLCDIKAYYFSDGHQGRVVLVEERTHRSRRLTKEPRQRPTQACPTDFFFKGTKAIQ